MRRSEETRIRLPGGGQYPAIFFSIQTSCSFIYKRLSLLHQQAEPIISHYKVLLDYLGRTDAGRIIASGVWPVGAVNHTKDSEQAYQLGRNV